MGSINKCEIIDGQKVLTPFVQTNSIEDYYSTEEEATNKVWIDGKRIYRRVLVCTQNTALSADASSFISVPGWKIPDTEPDFTANFTNIFGVINYWGRVDWIKSGTRDLKFYCMVSGFTITAGSCLIIEYTKA